MGKATVQALVDMGARVYALDINECMVEGIEKFVKVNLSELDSIDKAFEMLPDQIDAFFGVAGLSGVKTDYITTFNVNYTANMHMAETYLKQRLVNGGAVIFVTSTAGIAWKENKQECDLILKLKDWGSVQDKLQELVIEGTPAQLAYMYSKRLTNAFSSQLSVELAPQNIRVNAILPGSTDTGMKEEFAAMAGGIDNMVKYAGLAGRLASSEEMGQPIAFLGSRMASFISGEELIVDYCDNTMKKLGMKPEMCGTKAVLSEEELKNALEIMRKHQ